MSNLDINELIFDNEETEVQDQAAQDTTVAPVQYDITSFGADYDVEGLVKRLERNDIIVPTFQRSYVWTIKEASRFIESLLLGLPVPAIFLVREKTSNKLLVIDGQQRLKTLQFFYNGYFNPIKNESKNIVFKLIDVQSKFEDITYKTLQDQDRIKLNDSLIHAIIIKQESPENDDTSIYHIFERLNSQGRRLTPQEIRSAIHHGKFISLLKDLNDYPHWRDIYGKRSNRLKDQELILRFLALYYNANNYEKPLNEFLNKFAEKYRDANDDFLSDCRTLFVNTIDIVYQTIGKKAFRLAQPLNAAVFDSIMVGLARRVANGVPIDTQRFRSAYQELLNNSEYNTLVTGPTSDESNVTTRLTQSTAKFANI